MQERTYCEGCGTFRFKEAHELCFHCQRKPIEMEAAPAVSPVPVSLTQVEDAQPVTFGGATITAPGFTADQFERAMGRAIADDLIVTQDQTGQDVVCHAGTNGGYFTTRESCSCKAGSCGTPCKHRAFWIFVHDVRLPIQRRQWAAARKLVAA
jgi:hypothetical protein